MVVLAGIWGGGMLVGRWLRRDGPGGGGGDWKGRDGLHREGLLVGVNGVCLWNGLYEGG